MLSSIEKRLQAAPPLGFRGGPRAFHAKTHNKGIHRMRKSLLALLLLAAGGLAQADVQLKDGHPEQYTVVKGDTLWDISGRFLSQPWKWPELWHANPQIQNPDLIYPGDTLSLTYVDGKPQLMLNRAASRGTIKLSPQVRSTPMAEAIPTIPLEKINAFLFNNRIMESNQEFTAAPYVIAGDGESVVMGAGNTVFARGTFTEQQIGRASCRERVCQYV